MSAQDVQNRATRHEKKVFDYLESRLPKEYVLFNNRMIKGKHNYPEFDLIVLGKYAVYVVKIEHVMGKVIKGNNHLWKWERYMEKSNVVEMPSPLKQIQEQEGTLQQMILKAGIKVATIGGICLLSDEKPEIQIDDSPQNIKKIFWYKDLENFLTNYERVPINVRTKYQIDPSTEITSYHRQLKELIDNNFISGTLHENIPPTLKNGAQAVYYQVFEFLEGKTLRELIQDGSIRTDQQKLKSVILGVLQAMRSLHQAQWIHGDIKPSSFIITEEGQVKIIDFGLTQRMNSVSDLEAYSFGYTPPEIRPRENGPGELWTQAGDVYAAASVILALICGESELKNPVFNSEQVRTFGGPELLDLLQRDTSTDPSDRLPSAIAMFDKSDLLLRISDLLR